MSDPVTAAQAVLVLSSEAEPYRQAAAAYSNDMMRSGHTVTTVQFEAMSPSLMNDLLEGAKVFTAIGSEAAVALRRRLPAGMPLTYCMVADPDAAGLTTNAPTFGITTEVPLRDQFAIISEALPRATTVGVLYSAESPRSRSLLEQVRRNIPLHWQVEAVSIDSHANIADAVNALFREDIDVVWTGVDSAVYDSATVRALLLASVRRRVPVFGFSSSFVRAGAMLGVSIDPQDQGKQCAEVTRQLLQMAGSSAQLESATRVHAPRFRVEVNLVVAEAIGTSLPEKFVKQAHHVIRPE